MRMMMKVSVPVEQGNRALREGQMQKTILNFVETVRTEAAYFTTEAGKRTALFYFDMADTKMIPTLAEPFFVNLNAEVTLSPVMDINDLKAGLDKLPKL